VSQVADEKRKLLQNLLAERKSRQEHVPEYRSYTYDMFMNSAGAAPVEAERFSGWVADARRDNMYAFEAPRLGAARPAVRIRRENGEELPVLNFSSYNYLGYGYHPEVIAAAKGALDTYGLGACSSPVISGTLDIHAQLEAALVGFYQLAGRSVSLFSSGYGVNVGAISSFIKPGGCVVLDRSAHMSLLEGARLSGGDIYYFRHNDANHLEEVLARLADGKRRILVCIEGVYSSSGDFGPLRALVDVARRYGAFTLVDEAHSALLAGATGRGACEEENVLEEVDMIVMTFSKAFAGVGGALLAREEIVRYVNWYARCRMFSCALDPAVTAGMAKVVELAATPDGAERRVRLAENAAYMRNRLAERLDTGVSRSWVVTVRYQNEQLTLPLNDFLQRNGLDTSIMQFPAVPKNEPRIRLFMSSEHSRAQIDEAVEALFRAATKFGFERKGHAA
jgi:glycine C-acetyltransferase